MHITGTKSPFDCLTSLAQHNLSGVLHNIRQDVFLIEGECDHLFNPGWVYRASSELTCARSVTTRMFTAREGAEQHCQVGNTTLARDEMIHWLARFHQPQTQTAARAA
jgi:hypothetical protein